MIFTHKKWADFCARLQKNGYISIPACRVQRDEKNYLVLKHDVETNVPGAYEIAKIENRYGHCGSYYVQAYLLDNPENVRLLQKMQQMGHEISYHYDVMDSCKGDLEAAVAEFAKNAKSFEVNGFSIKTVCQHGNPVVDRVGYHSNRDFFRSEKVRELYPNMADIMVNYPEKYQLSYFYYSDAGRQFKRIYDPINNDINNSDDKNIPYENTDALYLALEKCPGNIISIHPHRWTASAWKYVLKSAVFKIVKGVAKLLIKIPLMKKMMSRYYQLAKKL